MLFIGLEAKDIFLSVIFFLPSVFYKAKEPLPAMADKCREPGRSKRSCEYWVLWLLFPKTWFLFPCSRPLKAPEQSVLLFYHNHLELQKLYYNKDREFSRPSRATYPGLFNIQLKFSAKCTFYSCSAYLRVFCLNRRECTAERIRSYLALIKRTLKHTQYKLKMEELEELSLSSLKIHPVSLPYDKVHTQMVHTQGYIV